MSGKTEPFTAGDTLDVRGMSLKSTCTTSVVNTTNTSGHVDGLWWGKPVRIIAKWADGATAHIDATFHDDND